MRLKFQLGLNDSRLPRSAGIGRSTVQDYLRRIAATGLNHEQLWGTVLGCEDYSKKWVAGPPAHRTFRLRRGDRGQNMKGWVSRHERLRHRHRRAVPFRWG
jgi:hypothetical protein